MKSQNCEIFRCLLKQLNRKDVGSVALLLEPTWSILYRKDAENAKFNVLYVTGYFFRKTFIRDTLCAIPGRSTISSLKSTVAHKNFAAKYPVTSKKKLCGLCVFAVKKLSVPWSCAVNQLTAYCALIFCCHCRAFCRIAFSSSVVSSRSRNSSLPPTQTWVTFSRPAA